MQDNIYDITNLVLSGESCWVVYVQSILQFRILAYIDIMNMSLFVAHIAST